MSMNVTGLPMYVPGMYFKPVKTDAASLVIVPVRYYQYVPGMYFKPVKTNPASLVIVPVRYNLTLVYVLDGISDEKVLHLKKKKKSMSQRKKRVTVLLNVPELDL